MTEQPRFAGTDSIPAGDPDKVLVKDLLSQNSPFEHEKNMHLVRAGLAVSQLAEHIGKTMETLRAFDLSRLAIDRHKDGNCFVRDSLQEGPAWRLEWLPEMAAELDTINARLREKRSGREYLQIKIQDFA